MTLNHPTPQEGALAAIKAAGGGATLARLIGVTRFAVNQWKQNGIPSDRLPAVSRITNIPMEELRPDLFRIEAPA